MGRDYYDEEYEEMIRQKYAGNDFPFGIYLWTQRFWMLEKKNEYINNLFYENI